MKTAHVLIKDATYHKIVDDVKEKHSGFRVQLMAKNGEPLMTSEVLESVKAVAKHIKAVANIFNLFALVVPVYQGDDEKMKKHVAKYPIMK
jgi:uncharacterized protein YegP (UPF0339 family)